MESEQFKKAREAVQKFYKNKKSDEIYRLRSWDYCYLFFHRNAKELADLKNSKSGNPLWEQAEVELGFYLGSFGMYRGSSKIVDQNRKFYDPIIEIMVGSKGVSELYSDKNVSLSKERGEFVANISSKLSTYIKGRFDSKIVSSTLITKILLAITGAIPAFDSYFIKGISACKKHEIECCLDFTLLSDFKLSTRLSDVDLQKNIISFYNFMSEEKNNDFFGRLYKKPNNFKDIESYPIMRVADLVFWYCGKELLDKTKTKKE